MSRYVYVGCGGFLGAIARYWMGGWVTERFAHRWPAGTTFPYGTLAINVSGSLILGFFLTLVNERFTVSQNWRFFFPIGFVGAYTTFSTYMFESFGLLETRSSLLATANLLGSITVGLMAVWLGAVIARLF